MYFLPQFRDQGHASCARNHTYIYTQFDAQNTGNGVSELPDFKIFPLVNTVAYSSQTG